MISPLHFISFHTQLTLWYYFLAVWFKYIIKITSDEHCLNVVVTMLDYWLCSYKRQPAITSSTLSCAPFRTSSQYFHQWKEWSILIASVNGIDCKQNKETLCWKSDAGTLQQRYFSKPIDYSYRNSRRLSLSTTASRSREIIVSSFASYTNNRILLSLNHRSELPTLLSANQQWDHTLVEHWH